jgi:hypothetical protein
MFNISCFHVSVCKYLFPKQTILTTMACRHPSVLPRKVRIQIRIRRPMRSDPEVKKIGTGLRESGIPELPLLFLIRARMILFYKSRAESRNLFLRIHTQYYLQTKTRRLIRLMRRSSLCIGPAKSDSESISTFISLILTSSESRKSLAVVSCSSFSPFTASPSSEQAGGVSPLREKINSSLKINSKSTTSIVDSDQEDSCKPNSKTRNGNSADTKESKNNNDSRWKSSMTPTKMITSMMMAYHNGAWTCPTPFYMEDWTHRDMHHVCIRTK